MTAGRAAGLYWERLHRNREKASKVDINQATPNLVGGVYALDYRSSAHDRWFAYCSISLSNAVFAMLNKPYMENMKLSSATSYRSESVRAQALHRDPVPGSVACRRHVRCYYSLYIPGSSMSPPLQYARGVQLIEDKTLGSLWHIITRLVRYSSRTSITT